MGGGRRSCGGLALNPAVKKLNEEPHENILAILRARMPVKGEVTGLGIEKLRLDEEDTKEGVEDKKGEAK